jgi:PAS domain S-box-containing protein
LDLLNELQDQKYALDQSAIVAQTDARGIITMVNDKFCSISGYSRDELLGKTHKVVNSGTHPKAFFQEMWRTIASGQVWRGEICNRAKSGNLYWVGTTITPFLNGEGRPYQYLAIRQDITALKAAEATILAQQSALMEASRLSAIGEMAAAITHEINNPLTVILGRAEMLQSLQKKGQVDPATLERLIESILATGKRIEKIVRSMKALAHGGSEEEPMTASSARDILSDALELCTQRFRDHGIRLIVPELDVDQQINCRSHQIVQVLVNLLNNAHDAVLALDEKWVELGVRPNGEFLEIWVTDSGKGIPIDVQSRLFTPFFSTKRVQYGTGLGLSISLSIMRKHGGDLAYDADHPNTRFVIRLPLRNRAKIR